MKPNVALYVVLPLLIGTLISLAEAQSHLRWFGFAGVDYEHLGEMHGWTNFQYSNNATFLREAHRQNMQSFFFVEEIFFTTGQEPNPQRLVLRHNYTEEWEKNVPMMRELLRNGVIIGFIMGDEICWGGGTYADLLKSIDAVRRSFPDAIIFYNEGFIVLEKDVDSFGNVVNYTRVPEKLDYISLDYYPADGTFQQAVQAFHQYLYPKMDARQNAIFVAPAYGSSVPSDTVREKTCGIANCTQAMLDWAHQTWNWCSSDTRIHGIVPWHYDNAPVYDFDIGARYMPPVLQLWQEYGKRIVH